MDYLPFQRARYLVHKKYFKSRPEWLAWFETEEPLKLGIPENPHLVYKNKGWVSRDDWFGIKPKSKWWDYNRSFRFVWKLKLEGEEEWREYTKGFRSDLPAKPIYIPSTPSSVYNKKGWVSWGLWLGTNRVAYKKRKYFSYEDASDWAKSNGIDSYRKWMDWSREGRLIEGIPCIADQVYKDSGWKDWGTFFGTEVISVNKLVHREFNEARAYARSLGLKNQKEWVEYSKSGMLPKDIPANPWRVYEKKGYDSIGDWLGTGTISVMKREYWPFEKSRKFVRSLKLKNQKDWNLYFKGQKPELPMRPLEVPTDPKTVYKNKGWVSMGDWLGTGSIAAKNIPKLPFEEAREWTRNQNFTSQQHYKKYLREHKPIGIPTNPNRSYDKLGWENWNDWLRK